MTITWVHSESDNVFDALEAVERGLAQTEAAPPVALQHEDLFMATATWPMTSVSCARAGRSIHGVW